MGATGVQTQEPSTGMVVTPHNRHSRCIDPGTQHRNGGIPSRCTQQVYRPGNSAQALWEPLIMDTAGVQTWELNTEIVGAPL
ncbi:unnamed protein product, partial [Staurois parvus]